MIPTEERWDTAGMRGALTTPDIPAVPSVLTVVSTVITASVVILLCAAICEALGPRLGPDPDPPHDPMRWLYAVGLVLLGGGTGLHAVGG